MVDKPCSICKCFKTTNEYYKDKSRKDGLSNKCKVCVYAYTRGWSKRNPEKVLKSSRDWRARNPEKDWAFTSKWRKNNKERHKESHQKWYLKHKYNLTLEEYRTLVAAQNNECAICRLPATKTLAVDHCHSSGLVRGLLCKQCNFILGFSKDSIEILKNCISYLEKYKK